MEWILILVLESGYGKGVATAEFNSKDACEVAKERAINLKQMFTTILNGVCTPKGKK